MIRTQSPELNIAAPTEQPNHQIDLKFELELKTTYATNEELKDPNSEYYKNTAEEIVAEVETNWKGQKPWKIEIGNIIFLYDQLAEKAREESVDRSRRDESSDDQTCISDDELVKVEIKIYYQLMSVNTQPTETELSGYKQNIVDTLGYKMIILLDLTPMRRSIPPPQRRFERMRSYHVNRAHKSDLRKLLL